MSNPFENVPASADVPGTIDKKTVSALSGIAASRKQYQETRRLSRTRRSLQE